MTESTHDLLKEADNIDKIREQIMELVKMTTDPERQATQLIMLSFSDSLRLMTRELVSNTVLTRQVSATLVKHMKDEDEGRNQNKGMVRVLRWLGIIIQGVILTSIPLGYYSVQDMHNKIAELDKTMSSHIAVQKSGGKCC